MTAQTFLGIDAGGTHTDAVLCGPEGILAGAKAPTCHEDLPSSVRAALAALEKALGITQILSAFLCILKQRQKLSAVERSASSRPVSQCLFSGTYCRPR